MSPPNKGRGRPRVKAYKNLAERAFQCWAEEEGWWITKKGWPDFIAVRDGRLIIVEVKMDRNQPLRRMQSRVLAMLADAGLEVFRWSPDVEFGQIKPAPKVILGINKGNGN